MMTRPDSHPPQVVVGTIAERIRQVGPAARAVHRQVLTAFAATGRPPERAALAPLAGKVDPDVLLRELHERDMVRLDPHGGIRCAYPFSATPTAHLVDIERGPSVYAMCAFDALGMSEMLHRDVTIRSTDPRNGQLITVTVHSGHVRWTPASGVVVEGAITTSPGGDCCPPDTRPDAPAAPVQAAADRCCGVLNFFTDRPRHRLAGRPSRGHRHRPDPQEGAAPRHGRLRPPPRPVDIPVDAADQHADQPPRATTQPCLQPVRQSNVVAWAPVASRSSTISSPG
jgi:hypothetical protein